MSAPARGQSYVYIYIHIPKCAGSTLAYHLEQNFPKSELLPLYGGKFYNHAFVRFEPLSTQDDMQTHLQNLSGEKKTRVRFVYGHRVYFGLHAHFPQPARHITFLRNPVARIVSTYYQYRRQHRLNLPFNNLGSLPPGLAFEEWLELGAAELSNRMTRVLSRRCDDPYPGNATMNHEHLKLAKQTLEKCFHVGITEKASVDLAYLFAVFGIKKYFKNRNITVQ